MPNFRARSMLCYDKQHLNWPSGKPGAQISGAVGVLFSGCIPDRCGLVWGRRVCAETVRRRHIYARSGKGDY